MNLRRFWERSQAHEFLLSVAGLAVPGQRAESTADAVWSAKPETLTL